MANKGSCLTTGQYLAGDDYLVSNNGRYLAYMQDDGNFVLYHTTATSTAAAPDWSKPFWSIASDAVKNYVGTAQGGKYLAAMQGDGNFVLYNGSDPAHTHGPYWASNTSQTGGQFFIAMQNDGNFVLYRGTPSTASTPLWSSNTYWVSQQVTEGSCIRTGQWLSNNTLLVSDNGLYCAILQNDGNFVLYHTTATSTATSAQPDWSRPYWSTGTAGTPGDQFTAVMQGDGNLVLYHGNNPAHLGSPFWASNTVIGAGQYTALLQNDANFVLYKGNDPAHLSSPFWASNTVIVAPPSPPVQHATGQTTSTPVQPTATGQSSTTPVQPTTTPPVQPTAATQTATPPTQPTATSQPTVSPQPAAQPQGVTATVTSQLMQNYMVGKSYSAEHAIGAAQDSNGDPLIFSIGSDNIFYVIKRSSQSITGWQQIDLSSSLGSGLAAQNFAVTQEPSGKITLALSLATSSQGSASQLYLTPALSNNPAVTDWTKVNKQWFTRPFAQGPISIDEILLLAGNDDSSTLSLIVATRQPGKDAAHWLVNPDPGITGAIWQPYALPTNARYMLDMAIGNHLAGPGVYALYTNGPALVLEFTTFDGSFNAGFTAPTGANKIAVLPDDQNNTDLYVAGDGVYLFTSDNQLAKAHGSPIAPTGTFSGTQDIIVRQDASAIAVWGHTSDGKLLYMTGTKGSQVTWSQPLALRGNVAQVAPLRNLIRKTNELLFVGTDNTTLGLLRQDPATTVWQESDIPLYDINETIEFTSYVTTISLKDQDNAPVLSGNFAITASQWAYVSINGNEFTVDATHPITVQPDPQGNITLTQKISSLASPHFRVTSTLLAQGIDVDPTTELKAAMSQVKTGDDWLTQKRQDGTPLLKKTYDSDTRNAAAQVVQQMTTMKTMGTPAAGSTAPVNRLQAPIDTAAAWGIQLGATNAVMSTVTARAPQKSTRYGIFGDFIETVSNGLEQAESFVVQAAKDGYHAFIKFGENVIRFVIETAEQALHALSWLLTEILELGLEEILHWLGFLFGWEDILEAHNVLNKLTSITYDHIMANISTFEGKIKTTFQSIRDHLPGQSLQADSSNEIFSQTGHSATQGRSTNMQSSPQSNWIFNALFSHLHLSSFSQDSTTNPLTDLVGTFFSSITTEVAVIENAVKEVDKNIISKLSSLSFAEILEILANIIAETVINSLENISLSFVQIAEDVGRIIWTILNQHINIPLLTPLYEKIIAPGSRLTLLDLTCLLLVIPGTIASKIITHGTLFAKKQVQAISQSQNLEDIIKVLTGSSSLPASTGVAVPPPHADTSQDQIHKTQLALGILINIGNVLSPMLGYFIDSPSYDVEDELIEAILEWCTRRIKLNLDWLKYVLSFINATIQASTEKVWPSTAVALTMQYGQIFFPIKDTILISEYGDENPKRMAGGIAEFFFGVLLAFLAITESALENAEPLPSGLDSAKERDLLALKTTSNLSLALMHVEAGFRRVNYTDPESEKIFKYASYFFAASAILLTFVRLGLTPADQQYLAHLHI